MGGINWISLTLIQAFHSLVSNEKYKRCIPNFQKRNKKINPHKTMMNNKMMERMMNSLMVNQIMIKILMIQRKIQVM